MPEKKSLLQKMFRNEVGEVSFRKTGTVGLGIGAVLVAGTFEIAAVIIAGKIITGLGAMFMALGQFEKNDRKK